MHYIADKLLQSGRVGRVWIDEIEYYHVTEVHLGGWIKRLKQDDYHNIVTENDEVVEETITGRNVRLELIDLRTGTIEVLESNHAGNK